MKTKYEGMLFLGVMVAVLALPSMSMAIPAFARKYGASCNLCHYPTVPRLNSFGHRFRRAGYRTEQEMNQDQDFTKVGNFLSVRGRVRYQATFPDHQDNANDFRLNDVTIFYGGALSSHFSAFTETEVGQEGDVEVLATAHGIIGNWGNFATFRVGQMHTLTRVGFGGLDRPTGISTPAPLSSTLTRKGVPFALNEDQRGLEATYVFHDSRVIAQVLNGINVRSGVGKGRDGNDDDQDKDFVLAYEQIIDEIASGFTVFGYRGFAHFDPTTGNAAKGPANRFDFWRLGVTGNKVIELDPINFEVQGGYVRSEDNVPISRGENLEGNAFFVELEQYFKDMGFTLFERYDYLNRQLGHSPDRTRIGTIGMAAPVEEYVRLALEGSLTNRDDADSPSRRGFTAGDLRDTNDYKVIAELMFNF